MPVCGACVCMCVFKLNELKALEEQGLFCVSCSFDLTALFFLAIITNPALGKDGKCSKNEITANIQNIFSVCFMLLDSLFEKLILLLTFYFSFFFLQFLASEDSNCCSFISGPFDCFSIMNENSRLLLCRP